MFEKKVIESILKGKTVMQVFPFRFAYTALIAIAAPLYCLLLIFGFITVNKWILLFLLTGMSLALCLSSRYEYKELVLIGKQYRLLQERKGKDVQPGSDIFCFSKNL